MTYDEGHYHVPLERQGDLVVANAAIKEQPPATLSVIVGDCVTNLRASLDYIAWELGTKRPTRLLSGSEKRGITFPIISAAADFSNAKSVTHLSGLCGVPAAAMDEIKKVQPYNAGYEVLGHLNILVNEDKHHALLWCVGNIQGMGEIEISQGNRRWSNRGGTGIGVNLKAFGPGPCEEEPVKVKVEGEATIFVTFQNPLMPQLPADLLLGEIVKCITDVIKRIEPFF
jgi:hypothetical protein